MTRLACVALIAAFGTPAFAQPMTRVCDALAGRLQQSPAALEGRVLNEALFEAAALDCLPIAVDLLDRGASVRARNRIGGTPLVTAAGKGSRDVATLLLARGADVDHSDLNGTGGLLAAVAAGRRRMVGLLLDAGADPNAADRRGVTPLMAAAFEGDGRILQTLLDAGAEPARQDAYGKTALFYAAGRAFPAIVEQLLDAGVAADHVGGNDLTALMWAAGHANDAPAADGLKVARRLVAGGARLDRQDNRGRTALMIAAARGHADMVRLLLAAGADATVAGKDGQTAADLAATPEIAALLGG